MAIAMAGSTHDHPVIDMTATDPTGRRRAPRVGALDVQRLLRPGPQQTEGDEVDDENSISFRSRRSGALPMRRIASTTTRAGDEREVQGVCQGSENLQAVQAEGSDGVSAPSAVLASWIAAKPTPITSVTMVSGVGQQKPASLSPIRRRSRRR